MSLNQCSPLRPDWSHKIALFDMDGTLTEPRKKIDLNIINELIELSSFCQIGIVSGSDISLIKEQIISEIPNSLKERIALFPCNGTQAYIFSSGAYSQLYYVDMINEIGASSFFQLYEFLLRQQMVVCDDNPDIKVVGNFIENRGSMINFCIPGRGSSHKNRKNFEYIDLTRRIRRQLLTRIQTFIARKNLDLSISIGGKTSIDIYPKGWDKTYVMRHIPDCDVITFVGDKCDDEGNDRALYELQNKVDNLRSFKTKSAEETLLIIKNKIRPIMSKVLQH